MSAVLSDFGQLAGNERSVARPASRKRRKTRVAVRPKADLRLSWSVLTVIVLLQAAVLFYPQALLLHPVQGAHWFKQLSGYTMLALMAFAMSFGWLRRLPAMARHHRKLNEIHQFGGLLLLVLLASHVGQAPRGFLLLMFHAMAVGLGAGALRAVVGTRWGRGASVGLLAAHIGLCCLVAAGVLLHLYFVYAYTA